MRKSEARVGLGELLERGGIYYALPGNSVRETIEALVAIIPVQPAIPGQNLLQAVLEREALMSTSIGQGIAVPHPRNPMAVKQEEQFAALAFLKHPVDWNALDGKPVDTLILIVSSTAKFHLRILSSITFFCREEAFLRLLKERAKQEALIGFIKDTERKWEAES